MFTHIPHNSYLVHQENSSAPSYIYVMCPYPVYLLPDQPILPPNLTLKNKKERPQSQAAFILEGQNIEEVQDSQALVDLSEIAPHSRKQVEGRNIHSNIFRSFLKHISSNELEEDFLKIKKLNGLQLDFCAFQRQVNEITNKFKSYVKKKEINVFITSLMRTDSKNQKASVLRIMLYNYCRGNHILTAFNSRKMQKRSRRFHLPELKKLKIQIEEEARKVS